MSLRQALEAVVGTRVAVTVNGLQSPQALWWADVEAVSVDSITLTRGGLRSVSYARGTAYWDHVDRVHLSLGAVVALIEGTYFDEAADSVRPTAILQLTAVPMGWNSHTLIDRAPNPSWQAPSATHRAPTTSIVPGSTP